MLVSCWLADMSESNVEHAMRAIEALALTDDEQQKLVEKLNKNGNQWTKVGCCSRVEVES